MDGVGHRETWVSQLDQGLLSMGFDLDVTQRDRLIDYLVLLDRWNGAYNLTAIRDPGEMVSRQLLDSLSILPLLPRGTIVDVGSGAGLPGIPLAIAHQNSSFTLLDANGKKARFLAQCKLSLGLDNVRIVHSRVEAHTPSPGYDAVVSRAFASMYKLLQLTSHLVGRGGYWVAMKGRLQPAEIGQVRTQGFMLEVAPLKVWGSEGERHALICSSPID